jgi:hypothetical protein
MPYVFKIYSLGISFSAPLGIPYPLPEVPTGDEYNAVCDALFLKEMPLHTGLTLKVREDQKLLHTAQLAPEGAGIYGNIVAAQTGGANVNSFPNGTNGEPLLGNRWRFPTPIAVPRGANYSVEIEFSEYGIEMLKALCGPGTYTFDCGGGPVELAAIAAIRVSLFGKRQVQQRGELHY